RSLPPDQEYSESDGLPRRGKQADADLGGRSHADHAPGAGRRGTPEGVGVVRDRRECAGGRWAVRVVLRRGRGNRRGAFAREGRGVDLRPRHAGRTGIRSGREGLIVTSLPGKSAKRVFALDDPAIHLLRNNASYEV